MDDGERRRLLRKARKEGWTDAQRAEVGLGPARPRAGGERVAPPHERVLKAKNLQRRPKKQRSRQDKQTQFHAPTSSPTTDAEVVELFGSERTASVNKGDIVPPGGVPDYSIDPRTRKRMKFTRLGKRWSEVTEAVRSGEYTWEDFVSTLTPEELARGQLKDKNGNFVGRPPSFVPRAFHDACIRELLGRGQTLYKQNYIAAIEAMTSIATNPNVPEKDRIKAAQFVIERLEGKVPERLEISASDPWQSIISGIVGEVEDEQIARAQEYLTRRELVANGNDYEGGE